MSDLTEFAGLSLAELTAEIDAMHPTFNAACSGQVTPSPADTAVRGAYFEDRA